MATMRTMRMTWRGRQKARAAGEMVGISLFTGLGYYLCYSLLERFVVGIP